MTAAQPHCHACANISKPIASHSCELPYSIQPWCHSLPSSRTIPYRCACCRPHRTTLSLLGGDGYTAYAPDWPGHGDTDKPSPGAFGYKEADYLKALEAFVDACGIRKPFALVVQVGRPLWQQ